MDNINIEKIIEERFPTLYELNVDGKQAHAIRILWKAIKDVYSNVNELKDAGGEINFEVLIQRIKEELEGEGGEVHLADPTDIDSLFV